MSPETAAPVTEGWSEGIEIARLLPPPARASPHPAAPQALPGQLSFKSGAAHTSELPYLFTMPGSAALSPAQRGLADTMVRYWTRFARTGNPNEAAATAWPAYTAANDAYLSLAPSIAVTTNFATDHQCAVWTPGV